MRESEYCFHHPLLIVLDVGDVVNVEVDWFQVSRTWWHNFAARVHQFGAVCGLESYMRRYSTNSQVYSVSYIH
jgi:hypothetical protein